MEAVCEWQVHGGDEEEEEKEAAADQAMLWSIQEALERQTLQIGASACGATAVVDVLKALDVAVAPEEADRCVQTRLRRNESPLPDYLLSRSEAGATHAQLIRGAEEASKGKVVGRFFHLHPRRLVRLVPWLARWIQKGAVPVATMNMQLVVPEGEEVPDAWHHQLIFGVAPNAVFMTNPLDVGQVRQMVLDEQQEQGPPKLTHVKIPAAYSSGITLFAVRQTKLGQELLNAPELPLL
ncbi:uncharacterized protein LOC116674180 isoform X2 [Etheostoma spectabile]|uniref:uncharacterized protein LOC116674180 isoform X2 n=1 Tax=Etheostoma spectabile TaxID=54343 RepID=UPI0013AF7682|nr:uncharacterized protein LOC116674180 isoform X2 [Etheostoma spectabile]